MNLHLLCSSCDCQEVSISYSLVFLFCLFCSHQVFWLPYLTGPLKAVYNPNTARLGWEAHLIPFFGTRQYPKVQKAPISSQHPHTLKKEFCCSISIKPGKNIKREAAHHSLQSNTVFFSQVNLTLMASHFLLLPPSFVASVVALDTYQLGVCLSIRKCA